METVRKMCAIKKASKSSKESLKGRNRPRKINHFLSILVESHLQNNFLLSIFEKNNNTHKLHFTVHIRATCVVHKN